VADITSLDVLAAYVAKRASAAGMTLHGPVDIEYGIGWSPTISYWSGERRVHFYFDMLGDSGDLTLEVAEVRPGQPGAGAWVSAESRRGQVSTLAQAWSLVEAFLLERRAFPALPACGWKNDGFGHDRSIPHPPDAPNPANIAALFSAMQAAGARPWQPEPAGWRARLKRWMGKLLQR
jgi:hypothetical protein